MRLKITLTLLVILLGLLTYIFYVDPWGREYESDDLERNALASLSVDIDFLRISDASGERTLSLELEEDGWTLSKPYRWPANDFAIERILNQLQFLETKVTFDAGSLGQAGTSLAEFGLEPPELNLELGKGEQVYQVGIGNATDVGDHLYLLSHDKAHIHVVDRSLLDSLSIDLEALRSPRIFNSNIFEIESWNIQLREASNLRTRVTKNDSQWFMETPIRARADAIEVNTLLGRLLELKSQSIIQPTPIELSTFGLENPFLRIAVESDQTREALEVGDPVNPDDETLRFAKLESRDTVFELEIDYVEDLENAQTRLRERRILEIDTEYATSISFERRDGDSFDLQKLEETDEWDILTPDQEQGIQREGGSSEAVAEALSWLSQIRAMASEESSGFVHDAPTAADLESYGLEVPEFAISITSSRLRDRNDSLEPPRVETLLIGDRKIGERALRYIKLREKDFVYLVSNDILALVPNQAFEYRNRSLFDIPGEARLTSLEIRRLADGQPIFQTSEQNPGVPEAFAKELEGLEVKAYLRDAYSASVRVARARQSWAYSIKIGFAWDTAEGQQQSEYDFFLTELTGGPLLIGGSIQKDSVFEMRQSFIDVFSDLVFGRVQRELSRQPFDPDSPPPEPTPPPIQEQNP